MASVEVLYLVTSGNTGKPGMSSSIGGNPTDIRRCPEYKDRTW